MNKIKPTKNFMISHFGDPKPILIFTERIGFDAALIKAVKRYFDRKRVILNWDGEFSLPLSSIVFIFPSVLALPVNLHHVYYLESLVGEMEANMGAEFSFKIHSRKEALPK